MKKALSMILVLTMVLALALPAMAEETTVPTESVVPTTESKNVTANYTAPKGESAGTKYYLTISWTVNSSLAYYGKQSVYTWNGTQYKESQKADSHAPGWDGSATCAVTVTNKSNAAVTVATEVTHNPYNLSATGSKSEGFTGTLKSAAEGIEFYETGRTGKPQTGTVTYTFGTTGAGAMTGNENQTGVTVATVSVTVSAVTE